MCKTRTSAKKQRRSKGVLKAVDTKRWCVAKGGKFKTSCLKWRESRKKYPM
jgi:hypothetical protein